MAEGVLQHPILTFTVVSLTDRRQGSLHPLVAFHDLPIAEITRLVAFEPPAEGAHVQPHEITIFAFDAEFETE